MQQVIASQQDEIASLKRILEENAKNNISVTNLEGIFSRTQLQLIKVKVRWSADDISKAVSIRCLSKSYIFIRNKLNFFFSCSNSAEMGIQTKFPTRLVKRYFENNACCWHINDWIRKIMWYSVKWKYHHCMNMINFTIK